MSDAKEGRRFDDVLRERRLGPSPLSRWNQRRLLFVSLVWAGCVLLILALGIVASIAESHGLTEVRIAFTRSNIIGLIAVLVVPPAVLTMEWRLMRGRRRGSPARGRRAE